jgi:cold shock CspA family protein
MRAVGTLISWHSVGRHGIVRSDDGGDVFVGGRDLVRSGIGDDLQIGMRLSFEPRQEQPGRPPRALNIRVVPV